MSVHIAELLVAAALSSGVGAAIGFANGLRIAGVPVRPRRGTRSRGRGAAAAAERGPMAPILPRGSLTLLFTDIEGSTRLLQRHPERYAGLLAEHQRILRAAFDAHHGCEIGTQGDGFFVVFRRARHAVAAAIEAQRALAAHSWPAGGELRVRMGLHTDEPVVAADTYVGLGVHRAARICAAGHGGQILVSDATRGALRDRPASGVLLADLGEQWLKDLDRPERLYQVLAPGLQEGFPRLNAVSDAPVPRRPHPGVAGRPAHPVPATAPVLTAEARRRASAFQRRP